jgi:hypothetical protein
MIITSPPKRYGVGPRLVLLLVSIVSFAALAFFWSTRNVYLDLYMIPFWAFFLSSYLYWGIYVNRLRGLHFALLPIALLAVVEIAWGSIYQLNANPELAGGLLRGGKSAQTEAVGLLQTRIDEKYTELFEDVRFFSDGFRALALPANVHNQYINTNEDGFRTKPRQAKPPGVVRIALLGGSAAFGWQSASEDATLAAQIEALLNEQGRGVSNAPRYEIVNFGVPAGNSFIDRSIVAGYTDRYEIDALLFVTGNNDLNGSFRNINAVVDFASTWMHHNNDAPYLAQLGMTIIRVFGLRVVERVHLFGFIVNDLLGVQSKTPWVGELATDPEQDARRFVEGYFSNMEFIFQMAQRRAIPLLVVEQPTLLSSLYNRSTEPTDPNDRALYARVHQTTGTVSELNTKGIAEIVDRGDRLARQYGARYVDGNEAFRGFDGVFRQGPIVDLAPDGPLFISGTHYTFAGARKLADFIVREMRDNGLLRLKEPQAR